jgi:hypothetical protein
MSAGAQSFCAPANRAPLASLAGNDASGILARTVSLHGRDVSLREALDRLVRPAARHELMDVFVMDMAVLASISVRYDLVVLFEIQQLETVQSL